MNIPATSKGQDLSDKQIELLKKINKWKDGMTFEEARDILDAHFKADFKWGLHPLRIEKIEKSDKTDKDGNPSILIHFMGAKDPSQKIQSMFFYPATENSECKSDFRLRALRKALGYDHTQQIEGVPKKGIYAVIAHVDMINPDGSPVLDRDGNPRTDVTLSGHFFPAKPAPEKKFLPGTTPEENKLYHQTRVVYGKSGGSSQSSAPTVKDEFSDGGFDEPATTAASAGQQVHEKITKTIEAPAASNVSEFDDEFEM